MKSTSRLKSAVGVIGTIVHNLITQSDEIFLPPAEIVVEDRRNYSVLYRLRADTVQPTIFDQTKADLLNDIHHLDAPSFEHKWRSRQQ